MGLWNNYDPSMGYEVLWINYDPSMGLWNNYMIHRWVYEITIWSIDGFMK